MDIVCHHGGVDLLPFPLPPAGLVGIAVVGLASGVMSGLLGVGGGAISTPGVRALGATPIHAVGSTIPAVLPSAIVGAWRYARAGMVDWRVALGCGGAGSIAAIGGAWISDLIDPRLLMLLTAVVLLASGVAVLRGGRTVDPDTDAAVTPVADVPTDLHLPAGGTALLAAPAVLVTEPATSVASDGSVAVSGRSVAIVGVLAGLVAGLLGLGGGVVMMPLFTRVLGIPVKRAVPASLVAVAMFSIPALITHTWLGHVDWTIALALTVGVIPGARLGSRLSMAASDQALRLLFGLFLVVLALISGLSELGGLLSA